MTSSWHSHFKTAADYLLQRLGPAPTAGVVLGSGLGHFTQTLLNRTHVPYRDIPHAPLSTVSGHSGELVVGALASAPERSVAVLSGRVHAYEGWAAHEVAFLVRTLATWGVSAMILTNASGGIRSDLRPGDLMLITDHINLTGMNPLVAWRGEKSSFVDMTQAYDPALSQSLQQAAHGLAIDLKTGVYAGVLGPSYETPAEIRMLRTMGADAVGMSTVFEVIALRHLGVRVAAIACITNAAAGMNSAALSHEEVKLIAQQSAANFNQLLTQSLELI